MAVPPGEGKAYYAAVIAPFLRKEGAQFVVVVANRVEDGCRFRFGFTSLLWLFRTLGAAADCLALCGELLEARHELGKGTSV